MARLLPLARFAHLAHLPRLGPIVLPALALAACGGARYRAEIVGHGTGVVAARMDRAADPYATPGVTDAVAAPGAGGMQLAAGSYDIAMRFDLPRAQVVEWRLECPQATVTAAGTVGESLASYRRRRADELVAEQQRVASVTSSIVGAIVPQPTVQTQASARTPAGGARVEGTATVPVGAVAGAAAGATVDTIVPAWDVGGGAVLARTHVELTQAAVCSLRAVTDDPAVVASYQVSLIHDLAVEARERSRVADAGAIEVRGRVHAQLVALGADETARDRRRAEQAAREAAHQAEVTARREARDAETRAADAQIVAAHAVVRGHVELEQQAQRAERDRQARVHAEAAAKLAWEREAPARARIALEASWTVTARQTRSMLVTWLIRIGANAHRREELEAQRVATLELRVRGEQDRARLAAALEQSRVDVALRIRIQLRGQLVAMGAVARPPMPALLVEASGTRPFDGAVWSAGHWSWVGLRWQWTAGSWADSIAFGDAGGADNGARPTVGEVPAYGAGSTAAVVVETPAAGMETSGSVGVSASGSASGSGSGLTIPVGVSVSIPTIHVGAPSPRRLQPLRRDHRR